MRKVDEISLDLSRGTLGTQAQGEKWFALIGFAPLSSVTVRGHVFPTSHIEGEAASTCHTARRPRRELPDRARGLEGFVACSHLVRWGGGGRESPGEPYCLLSAAFYRLRSRSSGTRGTERKTRTTRVPFPLIFLYAFFPLPVDRVRPAPRGDRDPGTVARVGSAVTEPM